MLTKMVFLLIGIVNMYFLVMDNDDADEYVFASKNVDEHDVKQSQIVGCVEQACLVLAWY